MNKEKEVKRPGSFKILTRGVCLNMSCCIHKPWERNCFLSDPATHPSCTDHKTARKDKK